ncbi:MAG TPA: hypothetical protein DCM07_26555 [Planctomycetaceae bacterium]|nr:hypothetical protein [Gimesia sp.]HAH48342.1 hypothetical protein [Planctomycetaceae bacterium]HBL44658.1 hypothetical protein [Planctomycetaceae bacterium]|tara:strand:- start:306 stop:521 length:216 start_codon:yes stop_codon:yes gene_type:complete
MDAEKALISGDRDSKTSPDPQSASQIQFNHIFLMTANSFANAAGHFSLPRTYGKTLICSARLRFMVHIIIR